MKKYKATAYPNWNSFDVETEAETKEDARELLEEIANQNCCFLVNIDDVEEVD